MVYLFVVYFVLVYKNVFYCCLDKFLLHKDVFFWYLC